MRHHRRQRPCRGVRTQKQRKEGDKKEQHFRIGQAHRQRLPEEAPTALPWRVLHTENDRRPEQQLAAQPAQISDAEPLQRQEKQRLRPHRGGQAAHSRRHVEEVTEKRAEHCADTGDDAVARRRGEDGQRSRSGNQLKDENRGDKTGVVMACIPGNAELDLKKFAAATGNKRVELVAVKEIQALTGYIRGGVSPLGTKKKYPFYLDQTAFDHERLSVSAGQRGLQMILAPADLQRAAAATLADLTKD